MLLDYLHRMDEKYGVLIPADGFVLKYGREWPALENDENALAVAELADKTPVRIPRECYATSARAALFVDGGYTYVEGYAVNSRLEDIAFRHAWVINRDGYVVE